MLAPARDQSFFWYDLPDGLVAIRSLAKPERHILDDSPHMAHPTCRDILLKHITEVDGVRPLP